MKRVSLPLVVRQATDGPGYVVQDAAGDLIAGPFKQEYLALEHAERVSRRAQRQRRICMRCREPFMSDGPGNRLCKRCRAVPLPGAAFEGF